MHGKIKGRGTVAASRHCLHKGSGGTRKIARVPDFQQGPDLPPRLAARPRLSTPDRGSRHCRAEADLGLGTYPRVAPNVERECWWNIPDQRPTPAASPHPGRDPPASPPPDTDCSGPIRRDTASIASAATAPVGPKEMLASQSITQHHVTDAVPASEIEQLPDLQGYLKFASEPECMRVRLAPQ
jgi:hypothetical protein